MIYCAAITRRGAELAATLAKALGGVLYVPRRVSEEFPWARSFSNVKEFFHEAFEEAHAILCVMACGIVVRGIKDLIESKATDPAIVVVDEGGRFAISLLSGHLGGANHLAKVVGEVIGAQPVITTATDVNGLPAFDEMARELKLEISDMDLLRTIHMGLLEGERICVVDDLGILRRYFWKRPKATITFVRPNEVEEALEGSTHLVVVNPPKVLVCGCPPSLGQGKRALFLTPRRLYCVGIGCNSGTPKEEIVSVIKGIFKRFGLDLRLIGALATIDVKRDEVGLLDAARELWAPLKFFSRDELSRVKVPNPSSAPQKAVGTPSVAEAAALLASKDWGTLVVEKQKSGNCTISIALLEL